MLNLQFMCIHAICEKPVVSLSSLKGNVTKRIPSDIANKLILALLGNISDRDCAILDYNTIFSKIGVTDFHKSKNSLSTISLKILISTWRDQLRTLAFPGKTNFSGISFQGNEFQKLQHIGKRLI